MNYAFVILHYLVEKETLACINSIKNKLGRRVPIVLVDNASPNESGARLRALYKDDEQVHVILSEKNIGFAKGNNLGISYARRELKADILIVLNNDTIIEQENFLEQIELEYKGSLFAVLGPCIKNSIGEFQNPVSSETTSLSDVRKSVKYHRWQLLLAYTGFYNVWDFLRTVRHRNKREGEINQRVSNRMENVKLHGSCLIFSPVFFQYFDGFCPETFMYGEEDLLILLVRQKGLLSVYNPNIKIFHAEKAATKTVTKSTRKKKIFVHSECLKSLKIIESYILKYQESNNGQY